MKGEENPVICGGLRKKGDAMNTIAQLQSIIDNSNNIVFLGGAGVSTDSGIRDFRGKNGLYTMRDKARPGVTPEYLLSNTCLYFDTELFLENYRENLNCSDAQPNVTHLYLKQLEDAGKLKAVVTQNIDGLHQKAGSKKVFEIHGTLWRNYCTACKKEYPPTFLFDTEGVPKCECGGLIRPDVVLYGEMLPQAYYDAADVIAQAEVLLVAGTSLQVSTVGALVDEYQGKHLVIINDMATAYDNRAELVIRTPLGEVFAGLHV